MHSAGLPGTNGERDNIVPAFGSYCTVDTAEV